MTPLTTEQKIAYLREIREPNYQMCAASVSAVIGIDTSMAARAYMAAIGHLITEQEKQL